MNAPSELARRAAQQILESSRIDRIDLAVTLGSGWKSAADRLGDVVATIPAERIDGFHRSAVAGHSGTLSVLRTDAGRYVLIIGARTHLYEGHGVDAVVHGVRVAAAAGARTLVLTNGAGGVSPSLREGDVVLIDDHLNLTATSPLQGATFVDLTEVYDARLRALAADVDSSLRPGVYAQVPGPHYETPAEVRMIRSLDGDVVGMSTALEAIAARAEGLEVLALSLVTNVAAGLGDQKLDHADVLHAGRSAEDRLGPLLAAVICRILREG